MIFKFLQHIFWKHQCQWNAAKFKVKSSCFQPLSNWGLFLNCIPPQKIDEFCKINAHALIALSCNTTRVLNSWSRIEYKESVKEGKLFARTWSSLTSCHMTELFSKPIQSCMHQLNLIISAKDNRTLSTGLKPTPDWIKINSFSLLDKTAFSLLDKQHITDR